MATEKNPNDPNNTDNVIELSIQRDEENFPDVNFEVDPDTGDLDVEFNAEMELGEVVEFNIEDEFYTNLAEQIEEDELIRIGEEVYEKYEADKESRAEWESMFERGFDLLGLKLEETTEPFEGAATAVHPLLIESAVKFQSRASQD